MIRPYGSSAATGIGAAGTSSGVTEFEGRKRVTEMYRQPKGAVRSPGVGAR